MERDRGPSRLIADCLEEFAHLAVREQQPARAARLLGAAEALRHKTSAPVKPIRLKTYQHIVDRGKAQLSEQAWDAAWAVGRAMPLDDAIDYALSVGEQPEPCATPEISVLSKRETEVLRLVVDGQTNREIADALFISPRTVAQHLRSIYDKLDVDSRTAAATWAVRNGLV